MINALHLIWIVPGTLLLGFVIGAMCSAAKKDDDTVQRQEAPQSPLPKLEMDASSCPDSEEIDAPVYIIVSDVSAPSRLYVAEGRYRAMPDGGIEVRVKETAALTSVYTFPPEKTAGCLFATREKAQKRLEEILSKPLA